MILTADSGYDIDMGEASGTFGFGINGGQAASTLKGSNRSDSITGNIGDDSLFGNKGNDTIEGGAGSDLINAGRGNGYIKDAGIGADIITHDQGTSVVVQNTGDDIVTFTATRVNGYVVATAGERTVNAETSTFAITLNGSGAGENKITYTGGSSHDTIMGGAGGDVLTGNGGNDSIIGGLSADTIKVGDGTNVVVFTNGLTVDTISEYSSDDIGSFDLSELEQPNAVINGRTLDFVYGSSTSIVAGDKINIQEVNGITTLSATTNVLHYSGASVADAAALEIALEGNVRTNAALTKNDAFLVQYRKLSTGTYSYAIAHLEDSSVPANTLIASWEVTDIATTDLNSTLLPNQFSFE